MYARAVDWRRKCEDRYERVRRRDLASEVALHACMLLPRASRLGTARPSSGCIGGRGWLSTHAPGGGRCSG
jgi:hypothetical protein